MISGEDDFFSTDMTVEERSKKCENNPCPLLVVCSEKDEYFPYQSRLADFLSSMKQAWPCVHKTVIIEGADHGISDLISQEQFFGVVREFISHLGL